MIRVLILFATFAYLIFQSVSDVKTMKVYTGLNNAFLLIHVALYIVSMFTYESFLPLSTTTVFVYVTVLHLLGLYGKGDMKALFVIFLSLRYASSTFPHPDEALFAFAVIVASVSFVVVHKTKEFVTKKKQKRAAYFPFLTAGYVVSLLLGMFAYT